LPNSASAFTQSEDLKRTTSIEGRHGEEKVKKHWYRLYEKEWYFNAK